MAMTGIRSIMWRSEEDSGEEVQTPSSYSVQDTPEAGKNRKKQLLNAIYDTAKLKKSFAQAEIQHSPEEPF